MSCCSSSRRGPEFAGGQQRWPVSCASSRPGGFQAGVCAFPDQVPFEFCESHDYEEDQPAAGRGGVNGFLEGTEPDDAFLDLLQALALATGLEH